MGRAASGAAGPPGTVWAVLVSASGAIFALSPPAAAVTAGPPVPDAELFVDGFTAPVELRELPNGSGRRSLVEQTGLVRLLGVDGRLLATYGAPLRRGAPTGWYRSRFVAFAVRADDPNRVAPVSERALLELDRPNREHSGGGVVFGPNGFLRVGLGDGGGVRGAGPEVLHDTCPVPERLAYRAGLAQVTETRFGEILGIDVDRRMPGHAIPPVGGDGPWGLERLLERDGRMLGIGRAAAGELCLHTDEQLGSFGTTGEVWKLVSTGG